MTDPAQTRLAKDHLKAFVERIERIEEEIKDSNSDKSDIYHEAKSAGFDVRALKAVIAYRRRNPDEAAEQQMIFETYLDAVGAGTKTATRARARDAA